MRRKWAVLAVSCGAGLLAGCIGRGGSSTLSGDSSRIFVTEEGKFQTSTVESYKDEDYYKEEELKTDLEEAVSAYNQVHGEGAVALTSCTLGKGKANMVFTYGSGEDLAEFTAEYEDQANQVDSIACLPVSQIANQIQAEGVGFVSAGNGKKISASQIADKGEWHAVVVEGANPVVLQTQGKLLLVSDNVVIKDHFTVETAQGKSYIIYK